MMARPIAIRDSSRIPIALTSGATMLGVTWRSAPERMCLGRNAKLEMRALFTALSRKVKRFQIEAEERALNLSCRRSHSKSSIAESNFRHTQPL
jgi:hypothetical protein